MRLIKSRTTRIILGLCLLAHGPLCAAIDNPDAPDILAAFEARSKKFELGIQEQAQNQAEITNAYARYSTFLDQELNQTYAALSKQLNESGKQALLRSQRLWIQFRDAEYGFIENNWTVANFGSSSTISRNAYRTTLLKNRVIELLHYLKNYRQTSQ